MNSLIKINTERVHIYSPDIHVGFSASINRHINDSEISRSIKQVQKRHPLLKSTVYFDKNNTAYYELDTAEYIKTIIEDDNKIPWYKWITESNKEPFNIRKDNMMRFYVSRRKNTTRFTALGHHMLGDGMSYAFFMSDFLYALDNKLDNKVINPVIIKDETSLPKSGRLKLLHRLFVKKLNNDFRHNIKTFTYNDYKKIYQTYKNENQPQITCSLLTNEETKKLIDNCKNNNVTVNEAITAAFIHAREQAGIPSNRLGLSCNIRDNLIHNPKESMGNFVTGYTLNAEYNQSVSFWENAKSIGNIINEKLKHPKNRYKSNAFIGALDDTLIDSINFIGLDGYDNETSKKLLNILSSGVLGEGTAISNLGKFSVDTNSFNVIDMYFVPPLFPLNDFVVGVLTTNDMLTLTIRYPGTKYTQELINNIINKAKALLL